MRTPRGYNGVKRWTGKVDIFLFDFIMISIHLNDNHCRLITINVNDKQLVFHDSSDGDNLQYTDIIRDYLNSECEDKKGVKPAFTQKDMDIYRDIMMVEILDKQSRFRIIVALHTT